MATAAVDNRQHFQSWQFPVPQHSVSGPQHAQMYAQPPAPAPPPEAPLPPRNEKELTRDMLIDVLTYFSTLIPSRFKGAPVRLVVHGGACMLLHPGLYALAKKQPPPSPSSSPHKTPARRTTTRDVDYINRSFAYEWHNVGVPDATERLKDCMKLTAQKFRLGLDWMNSDADVALPMANDPATGQRYDPIYTAALQPNNVHLHTVFTSPNGMLTLISVTPFWSVALKLVRYTKWDPGDICLLLRNGTNLSGTQWSTQMIEAWLFQHCWPMGYSAYDPTRMREMKSRIVHAIQMLSNWDGTVAQAEPNVTAGAAMGGSGDIGSRMSSGSSFSMNPAFVPPPPAQIQHNPSGARWASPAQHPAHPSQTQVPHTRKSKPSLVQDEWQVSMPMPHIQQHQHSHSNQHQHQRPHSMSQSQTHPHRTSMSHSVWRPQDEHVRQFDNHIVSMLHASATRESAIPPSTEPAVIPVLVRSRRHRKKQRDSDRKRDRFSKWFSRDGKVDSDSDLDSGLDSDSDSDDGWGEREKERERERGRIVALQKGWEEKDRQEQGDRMKRLYRDPQQPQEQQNHRQSSRSISHIQTQPAPHSRPSQQQQAPHDQPRPPAWHHIYALPPAQPPLQPQSHPQPQSQPQSQSRPQSQSLHHSQTPPLHSQHQPQPQLQPQSQSLHHSRSQLLHSRHQSPQPQPQLTHPHPEQPQNNTDLTRRSRSRSANPRRSHRPPSLELEPLHEMATLGIF